MVEEITLTSNRLRHFKGYGDFSSEVNSLLVEPPRVLPLENLRLYYFRLCCDLLLAIAGPSLLHVIPPKQDSRTPTLANASV